MNKTVDCIDILTWVGARLTGPKSFIGIILGLELQLLDLS